MHKIIFSHLFAVAIALALLTYQPSVEGAMTSLILALITLEMGFLAFHSKNGAFRVLSVIIWCFFYPNTFNVLMGVANLSWGGDAIWTVDSMKSFMAYLGLLTFSLTAGTLSLQLILKSFKVHLYMQLILIPIVALLASFFLNLGRINALTWSSFFVSPVNFLGQIVASLSAVNIPFIIGLSAIQAMMLILLGED